MPTASDQHDRRGYQFGLLSLFVLTAAWALVLGMMKSIGANVPQMIAVSQFLAGAWLIVVGSARWKLWLMVVGFALVWTAWIPITVLWIRGLRI